MKKLLLTLFSLGVLFTCTSCRVSSGQGSFVGSGQGLKDVLVAFQKGHRVYAYELNPLDSVMDESICRYAVKREYGKLNAYFTHVVEFILSDTALFEKDYFPVKQPFFPTFALKYDQKSATTLFFSFGTEEMGVSYDDSTYTAYRLTDLKNLLQLSKQVSKLNLK